jgi:prepilin-type N-terminal cleavage/methylation domain-containing protein
MRCRKTGFTLVEILIVVVLLGILAAIVIPHMSDYIAIANETNLRENLSKIRANLQVYRNEHAAFPDPAQLANQLTSYTDFQGNVSNIRNMQFRYGPYIEQMPPNPISKQASIRVAAAPGDAAPPGDVDAGWWYNPSVGIFCVDLTPVHVDADGVPYLTY